MEPDFSGYATKAGLKCSDGRVITAEAFKHMDGMQVPLVWNHGHSKAENVLGHAILKWVADGVRVDAFFNDAPQGVNAKKLVLHKDISSLSIYANNLVEKAIGSTKSVLHGMIREVSLVLAGANPGAKIDFIQVQHSDGEVETIADEAVIYTGLEIEANVQHAEEEGEIEHAKEDETVRDVYDTLTPKQKDAVNFIIGQALEQVEHSDDSEHTNSSGTPESNVQHTEGSEEIVNVFEKNNKVADTGGEMRHAMSPEDVKSIVQNAIRGGSLKDAVEQYALAHGIENIDVLFPDAKTLQDRPEFNKRRTEWVAGVLQDTSHSPFSRVKTIVADLTQEAARAKGYIKGNLKTEEWFGVSRRITTPTTIYKKQQLDRDDVIDITDFDVVAWLKGEMRMMLEEELARAILIGDGRDISSVDKIKDPIGAADGSGIRSIINDHELYVTTLNVNIDDANSNYDEVVDSVLDGMAFFKGTGTPTFYTTIAALNMFLKAKDGFGRRLYPTRTDVAAALNVREIVTVEPMNEVPDLIGIIVNLADYNIGADRGGEVSMFDDFDIDYNKQKYLIETRLSGALVKVKAALVIKKTAAANVLVAPTNPTFNQGTGVVTIPTKTGVVYKNGAGTTLTAGAQTALAPGASMDVLASPTAGYYFSDNAQDQWKYTRPSA